MCESCVDKKDFDPIIHVINPDLQPKRAARARAGRGPRYIFGESPIDPNVQDAMHNRPGGGITVTISADAWERIFGKKKEA
jgi:hypothetical protein